SHRGAVGDHGTAVASQSGGGDCGRGLAGAPVLAAGRANDRADAAAAPGEARLAKKGGRRARGHLPPGRATGGDVDPSGDRLSGFVFRRLRLPSRAEPARWAAGHGGRSKTDAEYAGSLREGARRMNTLLTLL